MWSDEGTYVTGRQRIGAPERGFQEGKTKFRSGK